MSSLAPTPLLVLALIGATILGAGIGACVWHLRSRRRLEVALAAERRLSVSRYKSREIMLSQARQSGSTPSPAQRDDVAQIGLRDARLQAERVQERHDALARHAHDQGRRIDALEAEILHYEARVAASMPTAGRSPPRPVVPVSLLQRPVPLGSRRTDARLDEGDLPVLNRRVVARPGRGAARPAPGPLDIPALSESELAGDADSLARELLDTRDLSSGRDD